MNQLQPSYTVYPLAHLCELVLSKPHFNIAQQEQI